MTLSELYQYLKSKELYCEIDCWEDGKFEIRIEWGDWKHDHAYCDYLMRQIGYKLIAEDVFEEDGSDCYSSTHYYEKTL